MTNNDMHALAGAYVMNALDDEEREAFEAYLDASPATRAEVASLREATALLGAAAAETPPEGLKRAVMAEIDTVRQERPLVTPIETAREAKLNAPRGAAPMAPSARPWVTRAALSVAAVAAVLSIGLGSTVVGLSNRLDQIERANSEFSTVVVAPDTVRREVALPSGGAITAMISDGHGAAVAVAEGLPDLDDAHIYALWGIVDGTPVPIGELHNGVPLTVVTGRLDALALTVEPAGELHQPTTTPQATLSA